MKRVRARTLLLVNWKSVFYERYALDEHVTALEGSNGAGKTTIMIAAYVVLLPDVTRLRFTNVGESDATGGDKGVWGRLGDPNRPSYAIVAFDVDDQTVLAGVHLERKGEPSVELTPFLISNMPSDLRLQDALLMHTEGQDQIPELTELREQLTRFGAQVEIFRTAKEYFAALFDRGITPLRLVTEEERSRFNDMLRTSMTGGISRALTSEFRSFLLKEESGLGETLIRMRGNLDACRRTRIEVSEAQQLEQEISGVYHAGHEMFAAALLATRERADELRRRVAEARAKRDEAQRDYDAVQRDHNARVAERDTVHTRLERARAEQEASRLHLGKLRSANAIAHRIDGMEAELLGISQSLNLAADKRDQAERERSVRVQERARAEETYRLAAAGMADLQAGLSELHRRAGDYRAVIRHLGDARAALSLPEIGSADLESRVAATTTAISNVDQRRSELDTAMGSADAHRIQHGVALEALNRIAGEQIESGLAHETARTALRRLDDLENLANRVASIGAELTQAKRSHERQLSVRDRAANLADGDGPLSSSHDVEEALARAQNALLSAQRTADEETSRAEQCADAIRDRETKRRALQTRAIRWRELDTVASRLETLLGSGLRTASELDVARSLLDEARDSNQRTHADLDAERHQQLEKARTLEQTGGLFHPDVLTARDLLDGQLLATHFDEVEPAEAGPLQARLGPLSEAIVVGNAHEAAATLAGRPRTLETLWLIEEGGLRDLLPTAEESTVESAAASGAPVDVVVEQAGVVRTTRIPDAPILGSRARQRAIGLLREKAEALRERLDLLEAERGRIEQRRQDTALLTRELDILHRGDPGSELDQVAAELMELADRENKHRNDAAEGRTRTESLATRVQVLSQLLRDAFLLDPPDFAEEVLELEARLRVATQARAEVIRLKESRECLASHIEALRRAPLSENDVESLRAELLQLTEKRTKLFLGREALSYVTSHREALTWSDAEDALSEQQQLVPALKVQCDLAERAQSAAINVARLAEESWETAREAWREIHDRRGAVVADRDRAIAELATHEIDDASDAALASCEETVSRLKVDTETLDAAERKIDQELAKLAERLQTRASTLKDAEEYLTKEDKEFKPSEDLWERLRQSAVKQDLLTPAIGTRLLTVGSGSINLWSDSRSWAKTLDERLSRARGGEEILERTRAWLTGQEQSAGEDSLQAWAVVRDWLRRRVPAQIAEVDDPLEGLERLRRHLKTLSERLDEQERRLRGASEDIARGIDVHIRSAQRQVRNLNKELEGVRFGTIRAIQIRLLRDDRMEGVLRALREGSAQELLFARAIPVEEALEALFTRFGGRGPTVGQKLLDYREYLHIAVEVRRQASNDWERVNPTRLSTGEAIGVGTALMMVVLTAWERAANLFRARRSFGTLRLLFLDEANRLSQDNLQVLFELCNAVDLQLLIAAPEVAHGAGCTTYRLVRRETADGGEEVVVSGRRAVAS